MNNNTFFDFPKLYETYASNLFTDLNLVLIDIHHRQIELKVHRVVLYTCSTYFQKMFTQYIEKEMGTITIKDVPDIYIANDIIDGFYGKETNHGNYPEWYRILQEYKCYDFFGLNFDMNKLWGLAQNGGNFPVEEFDMLVDFVDMYDHDGNLVELIVHNLPANYDPNNLPKQLVEKIINYANSNYLASLDGNSNLKIWQVFYKNNKYKLLQTLPIHDVTDIQQTFIQFSPDRQFIIIRGYDGSIIYRMINNKFIYLDTLECAIQYLNFTKDGKKIVYWDLDNGIKLYDMERKKIINDGAEIWNHKSDDIIEVCFCSETNQLAIAFRKNYVKIWNLVDNTFQFCYETVCRADFLQYSPDGKVIVSADHKNIKIWDPSTGSDYNKIKKYPGDMCDITFDGNNKIICTVYDPTIHVNSDDEIISDETENYQFNFYTTEQPNDNTCEYWAQPICTQSIGTCESEKNYILSGNLLLNYDNKKITIYENNYTSQKELITIENDAEIYSIGYSNYPNKELINKFVHYLAKE